VNRTMHMATAIVTVPLLVLAACGDDDDASGGGGGGDRLQVVASFYPLAEAAQRVGSEHVEVTNLTPAGTEPHDLELDPDQVDAILDADVVLYLGEGFQPAVAEIVEDQRDGTSVDLLSTVDLDEGASEALEEEEGEVHEGEEDEHAGEEGGEHAVDPHFWLDPQRFADAVGEVEAALAEASSADAATFESNAAAYAGELSALDAEIERALSSCERDQIVTSHAAFHYLAERYGLTQLPISGLSPESEPDADRIAELTDLIEEQGITTVFYETLVSPDVAEALAREADVDTAVLNPIEGLTDEQVDAGDDYGSVMRQNLAALGDALGCS
jgi:zinc transport system substrate-binding protein